MPDIAPISLQIWDLKYRLKRSDGTPVDASRRKALEMMTRESADAE